MESSFPSIDISIHCLVFSDLFMYSFDAALNNRFSLRSLIEVFQLSAISMLRGQLNLHHLPILTSVLLPRETNVLSNSIKTIDDQ